MSRRSIIRTVTKIALICAVAFVLVELLMIVTDPILFKGRFQYDPDLGFRVRAYSPSPLGRFGRGMDGTLTNRFGFNDRDYPLEKPSGILRILVVGDSFCWAGGIEGNYSALLERKFEDRDGAHRVDVINAGYEGTHTGEQLALLRKFGLQYQPDLVVLGFFMGNDFLEAQRFRKRIIVNKYLYDIDKRHEYRLLGYPIIARSRLWLFLQNFLNARSANAAAKREAEEWARATGQPAPISNLPEATFYDVERARLELFNRKTSAARFDDNIKYIFENISAMNDLLKSRGIKFVVAIYPDEVQVNEQQFATLADRFKLNQSDFDLNLGQRILRNFLESQQIPYLDMLDQFRAEAKQRDLYLFRNTHWNPAGNELAAQILFQYLNQQTGNAPSH